MIGYARVLKHHTVYLWRLVATYLGCTIDSYDNNVSGAFPQLTHHPDITRNNISLQSWVLPCILAATMDEPAGSQLLRHGVSLGYECFSTRLIRKKWMRKRSTSWHFKMMTTTPTRVQSAHSLIKRTVQSRNLTDCLSRNIENGCRRFAQKNLSPPKIHTSLYCFSIESVYLLIWYPGPITALECPGTKW